MKKTHYFVLLVTFFVFNHQLKAQSTFDNRKFIEVTGSAEMSVSPDEIELEVVLIEVYNNKKRVKISTVKEKFNAILKKNNVAENIVNFESVHNNWYWWSWWQSHRYLNNRRTAINLSLDSSTNFLQLVTDLNKPWVQSIRIVKTSNKNIQKLRKEVKKEAMRAAKDKATYLLESIDEKVGGVLSVEEIPVQSIIQQPYYYQQQRNTNTVSNSVIRATSYTGSTNSGVVNVNDIKLRYEIKAKFEVL
jgi:uncharacterized protein YggE